MVDEKYPTTLKEEAEITLSRGETQLSEQATMRWVRVYMRKYEIGKEDAFARIENELAEISTSLKIKRDFDL